MDGRPMCACFKSIIKCMTLISVTRRRTVQSVLHKRLRQTTSKRAKNLNSSVQNRRSMVKRVKKKRSSAKAKNSTRHGLNSRTFNKSIHLHPAFLRAIYPSNLILETLMDTISLVALETRAHAAPATRSPSLRPWNHVSKSNMVRKCQSCRHRCF